MKICGLEAQLEMFQKEIKELKKRDEGNQLVTKEMFAFQTKIDEF